ncbi:Small basic protein [Alteribacillus persepolensis]|uniref:Small basic protein n=1 Tax=Alteribacillus persepolensis TaxID=568899 RepID=A0A1G7YFG9_9BACI|nr:small basic family protein [Alteribacillus persepolensis]SDG95281.1 Small basic protein [Alteribacillus persepolensis]
MWLPVVGVLFGVLLGLLTGASVPAAYTAYLLVAVLATVDTLCGGAKAGLQNEFDDALFLSGFLMNLVAALSLTFLGEQLSVDLYLAAVFAFGVRLFRNIAIIRRELITRCKYRKRL